ncbi:MAG: IMPACT family protein [Gammaproteobacteria bacterium]
MHCVKSERIVEDTIKKSRFIGVIAPCPSEERVFSCLHQLQGRHPNATHIAYAYRIKTDHGVVIRFHDAGEPGGTAGKPILQHIQGNGLINVLIAVIRYFGGVKLGAGGLTRAYGNTAKKAVEAAEIIDFIEWRKLSFTLDYKQIQGFEYRLAKLGGEIVDQTYSETVSVTVRIPKDSAETLLQLFA